MARRRNTTKAGRFSYSSGRYGAKVRIYEPREGGELRFDYVDEAGVRQRPGAGIVVRKSPSAPIDLELEKAAIKAADDIEARLRLGQLRVATEPAQLTLERAFDLYFDPLRRALPASYEARKHLEGTRHDVLAEARRLYAEQHPAGIPWNVFKPGDLWGMLLRIRDDGRVETASKRLRNVRTLYRWLRDKMGYDDLKDPTRGLEERKLREGYEPKQPRYTEGDLPRLIAVSFGVDPRLRLYLALADDSGARNKALRIAMRSMLDQPLDLPPTREQAPLGWLKLPALKGQGHALTFLTLRQRLELARAMWKRNEGGVWVDGYLAALERRYHEEGIDYPLFPGGQIGSRGVVDPTRPRAYRFASYNGFGTWLREAERRAEIPHQDRRAFHGIRRAWSDYTHNETDLATLAAAGAWQREETPQAHYLSKAKYGKLANSREAQERKDR